MMVSAHHVIVSPASGTTYQHQHAPCSVARGTSCRHTRCSQLSAPRVLGILQQRCSLWQAWHAPHTAPGPTSRTARLWSRIGRSPLLCSRPDSTGSRVGQGQGKCARRPVTHAHRAVARILPTRRWRQEHPCQPGVCQQVCVRRLTDDHDTWVAWLHSSLRLCAATQRTTQYIALC